MLFPEQDAPQLKAWIVKRIENTLSLPLRFALSRMGASRDSARYFCF